VAAGAGVGAEVGRFAAENVERLAGGSPWYYVAASTIFSSVGGMAAARSWRKRKREKETGNDAD
jgi:hypothetical protein